MPNPIRKVTLSIIGDDKSARHAIDWVSAKADELENRDPTVDVKADTSDAVVKLDFLRGRVDKLTDKAAHLKIKADDKLAQAKLIDLRLKLKSLGDIVAKPKVSIDGVDRAEARILRLDAMLDRLNKKSGRGGIFSRFGAGFAKLIPGLGTAGADTSGVAGALGIGTAALADTSVIGAGTAALPFLGTAVGGTLVGAFGAGFAALGILGAASNKKVAKSFSELEKSALKDLRGISGPFVKMLLSISSTAEHVLPEVMKPLSSVFKEIAPPLTQVSDAILKGFASPSAQTAIKTIGKSFSVFLKDLSPQIPGIVNAIAGGVNGMAQAFTSHPDMIKGMSEVVAFLFKLPGYAMGALGSLTRVAHWMVTGLPHDFSIGLDTTRESIISWGHDTEHYTDNVRLWFTSSGGKIASGFNHGFSAIHNAYETVLQTFDGIKHFFTGSFDSWWASNGAALKSIWQFTWSGISQGARAGWATLSTVFKAGASVVITVWKMGWAIVSTVAKEAWTLVKATTDLGFTLIKAAFDTGISIISGVWDTGWSLITNGAVIVWHGIEDIVKIGWDTIVGIFGVAINLLTGRWGNAWHDLENMARQDWHAINDFMGVAMQGLSNIVGTAVNGVVNIFRPMPHRIIGVLSTLGHLLGNLAHDAMNELISGFKQFANPVISFFKGLAGGIVGTFKGILRIHSPSAVFHGFGENIAQGLANGLKAGSAKYLGAGLGSMSGSVRNWITTALAMTHTPMSWLGPLELLVSRESGGNPRAVNPIAVGSQHAEGLFQTLPSTFSMYGLGGSIFNPIADAIAGIRYIKAAYGSPANIPGLFSGHYVGYASGGIIPEPVVGIGLSTGTHYSFGERGPELITPAISPVTHSSVNSSSAAVTNFNISVNGDTNPDAAAQRIYQLLLGYRQHHGNRSLNL